MVAEGTVSGVTCKKPSFREYVRGFEPRATFPHHSTLRRILVVIDELQQEEQVSRLGALQGFHNKKFICLGIQLDMWTDTNTNTCYTGVNATTVVEPPDDSTQAIPQLLLRSEALDFEIFPYTEHTAVNIKSWFLSLLQSRHIEHACISGITPDGAADGQCALNQISTLGEKIDTCNQHQMQRSILFASGLAGTSSKNPAAKGLLRKHGRVVKLFNQSRAVSDAVLKRQEEAKVPGHKLLSLVSTVTTRWGNQFSQVSVNNTLRAVIDPTIEAYQRANKGKKDAIVEEDPSDSGNKLGVAVPAADIGLSATDWDESIELEAFLQPAFHIKETIGKKHFLTGAQTLLLMYDLKQGCQDTLPLKVLNTPATPTLADRQRTSDTRGSGDTNNEGMIYTRLTTP
ncbi:hypothetical protein CYMTET_9581 [Cymbomonas tetramitiformis]|uniref:Uncharacterized protein n=1 Tax=Cymbomonas tetramitiformis TaxID=36881 RepID=A0AAE0GRD6_9CHLO|nr:hypothetical protein CYMTET_9581 [Cymbomonas tetramitiformis]